MPAGLAANSKFSSNEFSHFLRELGIFLENVVRRYDIDTCITSPFFVEKHKKKPWMRDASLAPTFERMCETVCWISFLKSTRKELRSKKNVPLSCQES